MKKLIVAGIMLLFVLNGSRVAQAQIVLIENFPQTYICYRAVNPILVDGQLDDEEWMAAPWTVDFTDIEGDAQPAPHFRTRVKMLWDDDYLYIAAELEEPHLWATFTERESIIFHENNFEVFIDPTGDTHNYYELEINALGTTWDLMLTKPYLAFGLPISAWDIDGLKKGIHLNGTLNNPEDVDVGWTIELALPWRILAECAPGRRKPEPGEQWRVNFSRVQWRLDVVDGTYEKTINPETGLPWPEYNWVWSPQYAINMHKPEYWGFVQFSDFPQGNKKEEFQVHPDENIRFKLRELFYLQHRFYHEHDRFASTMAELNPPVAYFYDFEVAFETGISRFKLSAPATDPDFMIHITEDSRIWTQPARVLKRNQ